MAREIGDVELFAVPATPDVAHLAAAIAALVNMQEKNRKAGDFLQNSAIFRGRLRVDDDQISCHRTPRPRMECGPACLPDAGSPCPVRLPLPAPARVQERAATARFHRSTKAPDPPALRTAAA